MTAADDSAVQAAYAWAAGQIESALRTAGQHMHPQTRDEISAIIARLNLRADGKSRPAKAAAGLHHVDSFGSRVINLHGGTSHRIHVDKIDGDGQVRFEIYEGIIDAQAQAYLSDDERRELVALLSTDAPTPPEAGDAMGTYEFTRWSGRKETVVASQVTFPDGALVFRDGDRIVLAVQHRDWNNLRQQAEEKPAAVTHGEASSYFNDATRDYEVECLCGEVFSDSGSRGAIERMYAHVNQITADANARHERAVGHDQT